MAAPPSPPQGSVGPTRSSALAVGFTLGAVSGYALVLVGEAIGDTAPVVQWASVGALVAIAGVVGGLALTTYRTVQRDRRRIDPQRAVNLLLLGKASALVGAVVAGGYLGFAAHFVDNLDAQLPRERVVRCVVAAVIGVVIGICGVLLERACRVPPTDEE